jgi:hypothetical protein
LRRIFRRIFLRRQQPRQMLVRPWFNNRDRFRLTALARAPRNEASSDDEIRVTPREPAEARRLTIGPLAGGGLA